MGVDGFCAYTNEYFVKYARMYLYLTPHQQTRSNGDRATAKVSPDKLENAGIEPSVKYLINCRDRCIYIWSKFFFIYTIFKEVYSLIKQKKLLQCASLKRCIHIVDVFK